MEKLHPLYDKSLKTLEFDKVLDKICAFASSQEAKNRLLELRPAANLALAAQLQEETSDARQMIERKGTPSFGQVKNVLGSLRRANIGSVLSMRELLDIANVLKTARLLCAFREEYAKETALDGYFSLLEGNKFLEERIFLCILSEEEVADQASPRLSDLRRKIAHTNVRIREILNKIIHSATYQKYLQEPIVTMRSDRMCIPVKQECRSEVPGMIHDTSASGATIFVEPMSVVEANNELRVLISEEKNEIERILAELSALAGEWEEAIGQNFLNIVELDVIFSKAKFSLEEKCWEPELNDQGIINLRKARHPLIDPRVVVPVDVRLGKEFDTLVVTGPNTGGKTVTLKTMGLLCVMAAAGLHIHAQEKSEICIFSNIFADIGDEQSIEQSLSTFSSHMKNIVEITKSVGENTLVLFDELGAGTDPTEGAALAIALLEYISAQGAKCAATTHYSELKLFALSNDRVENASCEFDVNTLRPTYRLLIGVPGKSNAFAISKRLGLDEAIIENAKERVSHEDIAFEDVLAGLEKSQREVDDRLAQASGYEEETRRLREELARQKEHYVKTRDHAIDQARIEAKRIIAQAQYHADSVLGELEEARRQREEEGYKRRLEETKSLIKGTLRKAQDEAGTPDALRRSWINPNEKYAVGDTVQILNLNKPATVLTLPDKDGNLTIQAGIMKISVNKADIRKTDTAQSNTAGMVRSNIEKKSLAVKPQLDLRGQEAHEAILNMEKYIDEATIAGLNVVTIIHGKGTGALRAAVHSQLKTQIGVKSFRVGQFGEGDMGVTIVELG